jgi:stage V sporulation protein K
MHIQALQQLGKLPGMFNIKLQVEQIIQFHRVSKLRLQNGLKTVPQSLHMVFTGSPGTGKTTAARLIGEAFATMGFLKSKDSNGKDVPFVEIHQADITSKFVGEAEKTILKKFKQARGGVLFIDEAYAFLAGKDSDHKTDEKVITAIVQMMEDMREEVIVIVAGYTKEMNKFLDSNPGLRSRFANTVDFPDYSVLDMILIAQTMLKEREYRATHEFLSLLSNQLWVEKDKKGFGDARTVRNIIEQSIRLHSVRVSQLLNPSREDLMLLTPSDIQTSGQKLLGEKEILLRALNQIQSRLLECELQEIVQKSQLE